MMYATTSDFRTFSAAQVWVDKGYSTIDSTLIKHNGTYYRFTKDERSTSQTACGKFILAEKSTTILNRNYSFVADCIGNNAISQGEGPLVFKSNTDERWYMFIDEYGGRRPACSTRCSPAPRWPSARTSSSPTACGSAASAPTPGPSPSVTSMR